LPAGADDRTKVASVVDHVIDSRPDVAVVMRTSALRPEQVDRLTSRGIFSVAWFSDDPVLYKVQTSHVAPHYDLTLHTAGAPVLELYERELGVRGLTFPYWTDDVAMPRSYDPRLCDLDIVFIGNTQSRVKRWRYDWIASLPMSLAIYGMVAEDPAGVHAGVARNDAELVRACARGRLGLNISQRFSDYEGTRFAFPGLSDLGEFLIPSRIVQLAAVGVPVVSFVGSSAAADAVSKMFPPAMCVMSRDELVWLSADVGNDQHALLELSDRVHKWYTDFYSAGARARFLEVLVREPHRWTSLRATERSEAFLTISADRGVVRSGLAAMRSRAKSGPATSCGQERCE
jgi:hypothetical protein